MGYCPVTIGSRRPALIVDNRTAYSQFKPVATISKITPSTIISGPYRMARWGSRLHLICELFRLWAVRPSWSMEAGNNVVRCDMAGVPACPR